MNSWEAFIEPLGLLSLLVEGLFLVVAARALTGRAGSRKPMTV